MKKIIKLETLYDIIYNADLNEKFIIKLHNPHLYCSVCKSIIHQDAEICPLCKRNKLKHKELYFFYNSSPDDFHIYENMLCGYDLSMEQHISILIDDIYYLLTMKEKSLNEIYNNEYFICNI